MTARPELQRDAKSLLPGEAEHGIPDFLRRGLCEDEGCPQHGTPHVCIDIPKKSLPWE